MDWGILLKLQLKKTPKLKSTMFETECDIQILYYEQGILRRTWNFIDKPIIYSLVQIRFGMSGAVLVFMRSILLPACSNSLCCFCFHGKLIFSLHPNQANCDCTKGGEGEGVSSRLSYIMPNRTTTWNSARQQSNFKLHWEKENHSDIESFEFWIQKNVFQIVTIYFSNATDFINFSCE